MSKISISVSWVGIIISNLCFFILPNYAQPMQRVSSDPAYQETGLPFITNYGPDDYHAFDQNWDIIQDSTGIMYFANGDGLLIYNGLDWKLVPMHNNGIVYAVECSVDQRIYFGGSSDFGYLDRSGTKYRYISLVERFADSIPPPTTVRQIVSVEDTIYFRTSNQLYRYHQDKMDFLQSKDYSFDGIYNFDGELLVSVSNSGLCWLRNNRLEAIAGTNIKQTISCVISIGNQEFLMASSIGDLYLLQGGKVSAWRNEMQSYFKEFGISEIIMLSDSTIAIGTRLGGVLILDKNGRRRLAINQRDLIGSQKVFSIFADRNNTLWVGLDFGITKVEYPSPFSIFDDHVGLEGVLTKVIRHQSTIYVASEYGIYKLVPAETSNNAFFELIYSSNNFIYDLFSFGEDLLFTSARGLFVLRSHGVEPVRLGLKANSLLVSKIDGHRIFIGHSDGINSIYKKDGTFIDEGQIPDVINDIYNMAELSNGDLWLETAVNSIWRISFPDLHSARSMLLPVVRKYSEEDGLPPALGRLFVLQDELYFREIYGDFMYRFDPKSANFHKDTMLASKLGLSGQNIKVKIVDEDNNLWFGCYGGPNGDAKMVAWNIGNGKYEVQDLKEERVFSMASKGIFPDLPSLTLWTMGKKVLYRHDLNYFSEKKLNYKTIIQSVTYKQDSQLYQHGGSRSSDWEIPHRENQLKFSFTSPFFIDEKSNHFQYYLEGYESEWSDLTTDNIKEYSNLPEGQYTFKVRGKNVLNEWSDVSEVAFTIWPPWHRSWWAYLLYFISSTIGIAAIVRWRSGQLRNEKLALQQLVFQRTAELQVRNEELKKQKDQLSDQANQLKKVDELKSTLFANISHEFRTPLTLIKGPLDQLERFPQSQLNPEHINMMQRNTDRLLRLVNQLLDLSKLDAGELPISLTEGNLFQAIRVAASAFSSHAAERNLDYQIRVPADTIWAAFDRDKLEKIIYNLLSNAFKFTSNAGSVLFVAAYKDKNLLLEIRDTGRGIASKDLYQIFDRFYQVDPSPTRKEEGSGIGLALVKDLIELMEGHIHVESEIEKGTTFYLQIPVEEILAPTTPKERLVQQINQQWPPTQIQNHAGSTGKPVDSASILIVEDNLDMRQYIREQLPSGYRTTEAVNGPEGLKLALKIIPDLIVTDLMMPEMDGLQLCELLKSDERTSHIPVIILTAKAGIDNKLAGLETGADFYLTKPFDARELSIIVTNLIEQRAKLRQFFSRVDQLDPQEIDWPTLDQEFLSKMLDLLERQYEDSGFGVPQMQRELNMSKTQLHRKMKALTGHAPGEFLRSFRLKRAAQILQKGENVAQTAYAVGFNNLSYFAKCFRELHGVGPKEYIKNYH